MSDPSPEAEIGDTFENFLFDRGITSLDKFNKLSKQKQNEIIRDFDEFLDNLEPPSFADGGRIKASNGLGVLMDIFNAGNQRIETGDIDARFRPLPEVDEDVVSEDEKRIAMLELVLEELEENPEANRDLINRYREQLRELGRGKFAPGGKVPGLPPGKQVDAREGMFIPMGGAKRADDVPAMLSVNEFVLNDNAVAGLGKLMTGSPDPRAGARALYKIQDQLEAMVV